MIGSLRPHNSACRVTIRRWHCRTGPAIGQRKKKSRQQKTRHAGEIGSRARTKSEQRPRDCPTPRRATPGRGHRVTGGRNDRKEADAPQRARLHHQDTRELPKDKHGKRGGVGPRQDENGNGLAQVRSASEDVEHEKRSALSLCELVVHGRLFGDTASGNTTTKTVFRHFCSFFVLTIVHQPFNTATKSRRGSHPANQLSKRERERRKKKVFVLEL